MKLVLDQSVPVGLLQPLRNAEHDVVHVRDEGLSRATDIEIVDWAVAAGRAIVTFDSDFARLVEGSRLAVRALLPLSLVASFWVHSLSTRGGPPAQARSAAPRPTSESRERSRIGRGSRIVGTPSWPAIAGPGGRDWINSP